ncbi:hypothetical protein L1049_020764 [Liquidambar formosana]|uniref:ABC transmembrane type-1 domain-containing protein n=1 Tax=Liquidambar formosana TaxID=63359 RepID=A0AAP0SBV2_LIQFO
MVTGERQTARIRNMYLKTILRQDITFFDKETNTGEVVGRMSGDTVLIQDAVGEKVGKFVQLISTFIGGFVIAFIKGWLLTLVILTSIPLLATAGGVVAFSVSKMASRGQSAYAKAANIAEQTIGSIRTVASFTGEKQAIINFNNSLVEAYKSGVDEGLVSGFGGGSVMFIVYGTYSLSVYFGSKLIIERGYNGGDVINVFFALTMAALGISQSSSLGPDFIKAKIAAASIFAILDQESKIDPSDESGITLENVKGEIELRHVSFKYPTRPDIHIFQDLCLTIRSGKEAMVLLKEVSSQECLFFLFGCLLSVGCPKSGSTRSIYA